MEFQSLAKYLITAQQALLIVSFSLLGDVYSSKHAQRRDQSLSGTS